VAYCRLLSGRPELAAALGARARAYVARQHSLDGAAASYMRFLASRYGWGDTPALRAEPLWVPGTEDQGPRAKDEGQTTEDETSGQADKETGRQRDKQTRAGDQSAIYDLQSSIGEPGSLQSAISTALVGLGATEEDLPLIEGVSRAMAELGMAASSKQ
jgi:hypothetical protein